MERATRCTTVLHDRECPVMDIRNRILSSQNDAGISYEIRLSTAIGQRVYSSWI